MHRITAIALVAFAWACSSPPEAETPEQEHYLALVEDTPLVFTIPLSQLDTSIDRAAGWLGEYHHLEATEADRQAAKELARATDAVVILSPMKYEVGDLGSHGYRVSFGLVGDSVEVEVAHQHEGGFGLGDAVAHNAHILAYYIKTGELMPELIEL